MDLSALLVGADGKVRSDDDLVFYNQPSAESGAVRHLAADAEGPERMELHPAALPPDVDRVVLVASCDPDDPARTFHGAKEVTVRARQEGTDPIDFTPPPLTDGERAVLLLELYRRGEAGKIRAIGQGYANGLAGLATDFGTEVAQEPTAEPLPEPPPPPLPAPTPPTPPMTLPKPPLGTVSLDKGSRISMSLDKADRELVVTATLEWDGGSAQRRSRGADLDLYALLVPASKVVRGERPPGTVVEHGPKPGKEARRVRPAAVAGRERTPPRRPRAGARFERGQLVERPEAVAA